MAILQLALGAVGAVAGGFFGAPNAGFLLGSLLGGFLGRQEQVQRGPRLQDRTVTTSTYGEPIPILYGTIRVPGNIIWTSGIEESRKQQTRDGVKTITYKYFSSLALGLGEGPVEDVIRIWADGNLIFDRTDDNLDTLSKAGLVFRFYPGSEDQLPDPAIQEDVGAANTPAFRGLSYIVIDSLPLGDFGNRIPNFSFEVSTKRELAFPFIERTTLPSPTSIDIGTFQVDRDRNKLYAVNAVDDTLTAISLDNMNDIRSVEGADLFDSEKFPTVNFEGISRSYMVGNDGFIYMRDNSASNSEELFKIDPSSMKIVSVFGQESGSLSNSTTSFVNVDLFAMATAQGLDGQRHFVITGSIFDDVGVLRADDFTYLWGAGQEVDEQDVGILFPGRIGAGFGDAYAIGQRRNANIATVGVYRWRIAFNATIDTFSGETLGVSFQKVGTIDATDIDPETPETRFLGGFYDPSDDALVMWAAPTGSIAQNRLVKYDPNSNSIVWVTEKVPTALATSSLHPADPMLHRIVGDRYQKANGGDLYTFDLRTGEVTLTENTGKNIASQEQPFDEVTNSLIGFDSALSVNNTVKIFTDRGVGGGAALSDVVTDIASRVGLEQSDLDISLLSGDVDGFAVFGPEEARRSLETLAAAFFFEAVETDFLLKFVPLGQDSVATIDRDDMIPVDDRTGETITERRLQEVELPERFVVNYIDKDRDYDQGSQQAKRISLLTSRTMRSRNQVEADISIAMSAEFAKRIADKSLFTAWVERTSYEAQIPWTYLRLDPTDVVTFTFAETQAAVARLTRTDIGAGLQIEIESLAEDDSTFNSTLAADGGQRTVAQRIIVNSATNLFLLDIPLLQDEDSLGFEETRFYFGMAGFGQPNWPGAILYRSADGTVFEVASQSLVETPWGQTVNALGDPPPPGPFHTDTVNSLTVQMITGGDKLQSVTQLEMLNGANQAIVQKANGDSEIIQFRDVVQNDDGSFTLSGLLRGRRGTDAFSTDHDDSETFILVENIESLKVEVEAIGGDRFWKPLGFGRNLESVASMSEPVSGSDLKPWAPGDPERDDDSASPDIVVSWKRRTRLSGELQDGTGTVPLAEQAEEYEAYILGSAPDLDVFDPEDAGTFLRSFTGLTSPTFTYTDADQTTDGFDKADPLHLVIYQISTVVGRGFPKAVSIDQPWPG